MRDLAQPVSATWVVVLELLVVVVDRDLVPAVVFPGGQLFTVHAGLRWSWLTVLTFVQDRLTCMDPHPMGPTDLPDGVYYTPPPWLWETTNGYPLDQFRGFPVQRI